jgi:hypothetical protein
MLPHLEEAEADERWPRKHVDPEYDGRMRAAGMRVPAHSLDRPRYVAKRRPAWLAFLLRVAAAGKPSALRPLKRTHCNVHLQTEEEEEIWPPPGRDPEVAARLSAAGVRLATRSLDRPRRLARRRPAWLALLLRSLRVRG